MIRNSVSSDDAADGRPARPPLPTPAQVRAAARAVEWYFGRYHGKPWNLGALSTFTRPAVVGHFAVRVSDLRSDDDDALFRLLIAVSMFQRRQDQQILRILRSLTATDVRDLTTPSRLLARADGTRCACLRATATLHSQCDLTKRPGFPSGVCRTNPRVECDLKRHTILLRRYGHFGKVPTSAALALRELGAASIGGLRRGIWSATESPAERAALLDTALGKIWRVSRKISAMYLSMLTVPGLSSARPVWQGVDYDRFVVIDSNTDQFLLRTGYSGALTYDARLLFIAALTEQVRTPATSREFGPRLMQQAMYTFMSRSNRIANSSDCAHAVGVCSRCPPALRRLCPVRH